MQKTINLQPLQVYLNEYISPEELSGMLDDLVFDYMNLMITNCQQREKTDKDDLVFLKSKSFIFHLRQLRDILQLCSVG